MILCCDESVDGPIVRALRRDGFEVLYIAEMEPGISDEDVLTAANGRGALLVTGDTDFGELVYRQGRVSAGVVLIRLSGLSAEAKATVVSATFREHRSDLVGAFSVISPGLVRVRRSPPPGGLL
jgi:predicted nuclease of predicted toxin-antitoxin system